MKFIFCGGEGGELEKWKYLPSISINADCTSCSISNERSWLGAYFNKEKSSYFYVYTKSKIIFRIYKKNVKTCPVLQKSADLQCIIVYR